MTLTKNPILILNKSWIPVRVSTFKKALGKVCSERARFVDHESYCLFTWDEWVESFCMSHEEASSSKHPIIKGVNFSVRQPEVVVCNIYNNVPKNDLRLTRRNLLVRDNFKCQYCGIRVNSKEATIDHIMPRSRGGKNTWQNLTISCIDCNVSKGNKTPQEAGMILHTTPKKPIWNPLYTLLHKKRPKSWSKFINTDKWNEIGYWDVELQG